MFNMNSTVISGDKPLKNVFSSQLLPFCKKMPAQLNKTLQVKDIFKKGSNAYILNSFEKFLFEIFLNAMFMIEYI